jgi:hypothetical protein
VEVEVEPEVVEAQVVEVVEAQVVLAEVEEVHVVAMQPVVAVHPVVTEPVTAEEAEAVVLEQVAAARWKAVWSVWRQSRPLRTEATSGGLSRAEQDLADLGAILDVYCRHLADSREGMDTSLDTLNTIYKYDFQVFS